MNGKELHEARKRLGLMWGLGRTLHMSELARALRLQGRDPGQTIRGWERQDGPTGPASVAIEMMLSGTMPPDSLDIIILKDERLMRE